VYDVAQGRAGRKTRRSRVRRSRLGTLWLLVGVLITAAAGAVSFKVAQPHLAAGRQAQRNAELRRKIEDMRKENITIRHTRDELQTDAGAEAAARGDGWRKPDETPVLVPDGQPKKADSPAPAAGKTR